MQKPRKSGRKLERKRFKPLISPPIVGSTAKLISGHKGQAGTNTNEAIDVCFRVNGALMSLPQSSVEEKIMDKVLWNFMMKKAAGNMSKLIEETISVGIIIAAETEFIPDDAVGSKLSELGIDENSREQYFPNGQVEYYHSWTGARLDIHREGFVNPTGASTYKIQQDSLRCMSSLKKRGLSWNNRLDPLCVPLLKGRTYVSGNFICLFEKEPSFKLRGLCKDAVMDTQYKFAGRQ